MLRRLLALALLCTLAVAGPSSAGTLGLLGAGKGTTTVSGGGGVTFRATPANTTAKETSGSNISSNSAVTLFLWAINVDTTGCTNGNYYMSSSGSQFYARAIAGTGTCVNVRINIGTANQIQFDVVGLTAGGQNRVVIKVDSSKATCTTSGAIQAWINDTDVTPATCSAWTAVTVDMSGSLTWYVNDASTCCGGAGAGGTYYWIYYDHGGHAGTYPDFSQQSNRDKLKQGTLLADASNVAGSAPYIFFGGTTLGDWTTPVHHGTAGATWVSASTWSLFLPKTRFAMIDELLASRQ